MKKILLLLNCLFFILSFNSFGQLLTTNTFTGSTGTCPTQSNTFSSVTNATVAPLSRNLTVCAVAGNVFNSSTLNNTASRNDASYIEFSITANSGYGVNLTSLSFFRQGSNTAPNSLIVSYSTDPNAANFNSTRVDMAVSTTTNPGTNLTWTFPSAITTIAGGKITFRFYPYGTVSVNGAVAATSGAFRLDDVSIFGTVVNAAPTLTATPNTLTNLNYTSGNGPSVANSYTLSGSVLASGDSVKVFAPMNFEVSNTSAMMGFADSLKILYAGTVLPATTIYTRLKAGLSNASYTGNITHKGGGVAIPSLPTVSLSGSVTSVPPPIITTTGTLGVFNTVIGTPSASQPYTVSGVDLVSDIVITAPADFEIKTGAGAYANSLNLSPSSGSVSAIINVRLKGTASGTFTGNITHASTNVSPAISVAVSGVVGANCGTAINIGIVRAPIPEQRDYTTGAISTIAGRVTARLGTAKFYLQDATGGIAIYSTNNGGVAQANNISVGDSIILTGQAYRAFGEAEIFNPTCVTKISTGAAPTPIIFNSNTPPSGVDLNTFLAQNEGRLIKIVATNVLSTGTFVAAINYTTITCNSQGGTEIRVDAGATTLAGSAIPTVTQDIVGVVGHFISTDGGTNKLQLFPRSASDLVNSATTCTISGGCGVTSFTDSPTQLDVFNWNVEWLGNPTNGPSQSGTNDAIQIANAQTVLNGVGADVYMLQEICQYNAANPTDNTTAFGKLIQGLNTTFGVNTYSGECSAGVSVSNPDGFPQRVCIIYKNSVVTKVFSRPMFNGFTPASYPPTGSPSQFWGSGRKPFMFMAKVNINSQSDTILFVGLHAKAGSDTTSYKRRKFDVRAMYDTLQTQYPTRKTIILGDLNDDVDKSITKDSISSYRPFLYTNPNETAISGVRPNPDWNPVSKTLTDASCASTAAFSDYIDHQIVSNEMSGVSTGYRYVPSSVTSFRPTIANYASTTSDHYPTIARYQYITPVFETTTTGNWNVGTTWVGGSVPPTTADVIIKHNVTIPNTYTANAKNIKLDNGGTLTLVGTGTVGLN
jgi:hypothetical protein